MKKQKEIVLNKRGIYITKEIIETNPNDGIVSKKNISSIDRSGNHYKGYSKTVVYTTNDPKMILCFLTGICFLFFVIGIFLLIIGELFFGIIFSFISVVFFIKEKKTIERKIEELKINGYNDSITSNLEKEQLKNKSIDTIKNDCKDIKTTTFTKDKYNWFLKTTLPFYCAISIILVLINILFISIEVGLLIFICLAIGGFLYYYLIFKLFKN